MSQVSITRRYRFCAAHRLHSEYLSPEANWTAFGKCNNPNGHGHNYVVLVTMRRSEDGHPVDVAAFDQVVMERIVRRFDHHDLNHDPEFAERTTTGENLVLLIWDLLAPYLPAGQLEKVGLIETRDNYFEYAGSAREAMQTARSVHG